MRRVDIEAPEVEWDGFDRLVHNGELFTGEAVHVEDGKVLALTTYRDGVEQGPQWEVSPDGTKLCEGQCDQGHAVGEWRTWYPDGKPQSHKVLDRWGDLRRSRHWDADGVLVEDSASAGLHGGRW